ncbi:hypothetical protein AM587_10000260 [Phytophthora nicotianae]|uniref:Uncharacterized protein n=1 Tax=Phytophthora nicotianae TaxID=4792 RepID=A0A0W8CH82_PHYNI|nr:hypothetical protein AM587_10000260 [Phytophthora nicotianae]
MRPLSRRVFTGPVRPFIKDNYPRVKFSDEAVRLLRLKLPPVESNSSELTSLLSEAFIALLQGGRRHIEGSYVKAWSGLLREPSDAAEDKATPMGAENTATTDSLEDSVSTLDADEKQQPPSNARGETHFDAGSTRAEEKEPTPSNNNTANSDNSDSESDVIWIPPPRVAEAKLTLHKALGDDSGSSDEETKTTETLAAGNYYVRSITDSYVRDGQRVYVTDWEATDEPAANLPPRMFAAFNRRGRAQVRRAFIEDEAGHTRERRRPSAEAPSSRRQRLRRLRRYADA